MSKFTKLAGVILLGVTITGAMGFAGDEANKDAGKKKCAKACKTACEKHRASGGDKEACKAKCDASNKKCRSNSAKRKCGDVMSKADTNKDGKLSFKEFKASNMEKIKSQFKKMDTDGDGFLTKDDRKGKRCKSGKKKKVENKPEA